MKSHALAAALAISLLYAGTGAALAQAPNEEQMQQYAQAGQRALASGKYDEARENLEQALKLNPNIAELHAMLAAVYFKQRAYASAVQEIRTAQKQKPGLPRLDSLLGLSLSEMGDFREALPHLEKWFRQSKEPDVRRMCGLQLLRAYDRLGRDSETVETALQLNKLYPDDPEVLYHTGRVYGNQAYVVMEKLHDSAPNSIWMLQAQGEANEANKDPESAIIAFNHVLKIDPRRPGMHYRIGRVYLRRYNEARRPEDREQAEREFNAELEIDPNNGNAAYELAQMAADDNKLEEAKTRFEQVVQRFPDFEQALVGLGGVYLQAQNSAQAVQPLKQATKLDPSDEVAWYRLAQAERGAGNREGAQMAMQTFRKLHDSSSAAHKPPALDSVTAQELRSDPQQQP
ncbi:tetratricopeptide repeat protein [Occallatibacter riparius]|uniref:Tetratricopeptide repeat protein n=1 Tax=Occallatibacter riparius TaxID=1002689 RepID=A0A9J7BUB3_9BACT|nr:tetratricopeptide repeat protein [Occallatibacter riparius]UWZ84581.1 tetratricopeptide repeat protein [Occallatibacter riparius]